MRSHCATRTLPAAHTAGPVIDEPGMECSFIGFAVEAFNSCAPYIMVFGSSILESQIASVSNCQIFNRSRVRGRARRGAVRVGRPGLGGVSCAGEDRSHFGLATSASGVP